MDVLDADIFQIEMKRKRWRYRGFTVKVFQTCYTRKFDNTICSLNNTTTQLSIVEKHRLDWAQAWSKHVLTLWAQATVYLYFIFTRCCMGNR